MFAWPARARATCSQASTKRVWMPTPPGPLSSRQNAANESSALRPSVAHAGAPSPPVERDHASWWKSTSVRIP